MRLSLSEKIISSQVHVADESPIADHCMAYALSEPRDSSFRQKCQHIHEEHCPECDELNSVLDEIHRFVEEASFKSKDDSDEAIFVVKHSKEMIQAWKAHQLHTVRQDESRLQILRQLDTDSVLITQDWAMKFLPRKYRESQSDWFGYFLARIRSRSPPKRPVGISRLCTSDTELHPGKLGRSLNYGTCPRKLEETASRDKESVLSPR